MDADELQVEELLKSKGLRPERFSKDQLRRGRTPDFKVFNGDELVFYCEVKTICYDQWLDNKMAEVPPSTIAGGLRPDPIFNRLTDDIHAAVKQFDAVNPDLKYPNVLVLVNHDDICGVQDLWGVLTGAFIAEGFVPHYIYPQYSEGRIKIEKGRVHLFVWADNSLKVKYVFNQSGARTHEDILCKLFGLDLYNIKSIGV